MDNHILLPHSAELEAKSMELGFTKTYFLGKDLATSTAASPKELLNDCQKAHAAKRKLVYLPANPDLLRFAIEKAPVDIILGIEQLYPHDSLHYPKAGLDQVLGPLAKQKNKTIGFSFSQLLHAQNRSKQMLRIAFNAKVCKKYGLTTAWSTFATHPEDLRSAKDLQAFWQFLTTQILK